MLLSVCLALGLSACAGTSSDSTTAGGGSGTGATPPSHQDSGGGAKQFEVPGGDNSISRYGVELSDSELEEAAAALHAYLDARAARAWKVACEHLDPAVIAQLYQLSNSQGGGGGKGQNCAEALGMLSAGASTDALREAAVADVASLRAEGKQGFLLFQGARGVKYFIPVVREDGAWKVAAIAASPLS